MARATSSVTVRPRRVTDDDFIHDLAALVFAPYSRDPVASAAAMMSEKGARTVVAEGGRGPLGYAVVTFYQHKRDYGPWRRPVLASLDAIAVKPQAQGRGVGRVLLAHVEELAREAGAVGLSLRTAEANSRARQLFESAGFLSVAALPQFYVHGQGAVAMTKALLDDG
jgi:ribosomal protein S18 acetylase RimI-like enzyme